MTCAGVQTVAGRVQIRWESNSAGATGLLPKNVKRPIGRPSGNAAGVMPGPGWEGKDGTLVLTGGAQARRVAVLRRPIQGEVVPAGEDNGQQVLGFIGADRRNGKQITGYGSAVRVTHADYGILSLGQLYRDRYADEKSCKMSGECGG